MEKRECPQYLDLVRYNLRDFVGSLIGAWWKNFIKFPKIEDRDQEMEFQLFVGRYQLVEPLIKERDVVYESLIYSELYVPAGFIWKTDREMQQQTVFIRNIPLMNSLGTSIVNGIYRIVINQIFQSPSIYYQFRIGS
ncbi:RNA polymerase beta subunit [Iris pallida]|uniref:DNA-directed RNA polymerase n=1 Tax=Iris pallida TaxID=29817 RepID=A0AAX6ESA0_IRIPA|nr:RNA polymerase beta subunit [Iris pallida]